MKMILSALVLIASVSAFAQGKKDPCEPVRVACEKAGFTKKGNAEGKGLWKDCIDKLLRGEALPTVGITGEEVNACKATKPVDKTAPAAPKAAAPAAKTTTPAAPAAATPAKK